jgi:hypothetical protein
MTRIPDKYGPSDSTCPPNTSAKVTSLNGVVPQRIFRLRLFVVCRSIDGG